MCPLYPRRYPVSATLAVVIYNIDGGVVSRKPKAVIAAAAGADHAKIAAVTSSGVPYSDDPV